MSANPPGRPSEYRPEYAEHARKLCLLGAIDKDLADWFEVDERTINNWKLAHPEFFQSLKDGKAKADALVAHSLYHRALGYSHPAVKILTVANGGDNGGSSIEQVDYTEHYPPDTAAAIFWLKNRRPDQWRDKVQQEVTGANGGPVEVRVRVLREGRRVTASP